VWRGTWGAELSEPATLLRRGCWLPEVRSAGPEVREPPGSTQGVEWERMPQGHRGFPEFHAALQASSLLVARARPAMRFRKVLPEKLGRGRRVCGEAIKETKIGYLLGRENTSESGSSTSVALERSRRERSSLGTIGLRSWCTVSPARMRTR
jgi:hypothetical protein